MGKGDKTYLLKLENIVVRYGTVEAIKGISMELERGSLIAVVGANGAGKSTILRTISGLEKVTSGRILLDGERIDGASPTSIVARGISHVPEGRKLFPNMMVYENLKMGGYIEKDKARFEESLHKVYELFPVLKSRSRQLAGTLSGGEQQMLAIGRALMSNPRILLMDEPTTGLAPYLVTMLSESIAELSSKGLSIVLVEQNVRFALDLAYWCYVTELGRIALEGPADNIRNNEHVKEAYLGR